MRVVLRSVAASLAFAMTIPAWAEDIGQVKVAKGQVSIERAGATLPASVGTRLQVADVVTTGADGSIGITMNDDSLLSAGANSRLTLERFVHDPSTNQGRFSLALNRGTLAVISGRIAKQSPDA
ncbi:MAG: hypothetical protein ABIV63_14395, partial [Caldimonas sp.]